MPETYDEAVEKKRRKERKEEAAKYGGEFDAESSIDFDGELLEEKWQKLMSFLVPPQVGEGPEVGDEKLRNKRDLSNVIDVNLDKLNNAELLSVIAKSNIAQLQALFDIATAVESPTAITVSGSEIITEKEQPKRVVPQSGSGEVPTRTLFIRSSTENTDKIAFGDDQVQPTGGFILAPGESITIPIDLRESDLYMASDSQDQVVNLLGVF